jgi:hypothetical protein
MTAFVWESAPDEVAFIWVLKVVRHLPGEKGKDGHSRPREEQRALKV